MELELHCIVSDGPQFLAALSFCCSESGFLLGHRLNEWSRWRESWWSPPGVSTVEEASAHSFGSSTAPCKEGTSCAPGTRTSVPTVCWWMGHTHAMLNQPLTEQSASLDSKPIASTWGTILWLIHQGHAFLQADFSFHRSSLGHFVVFCWFFFCGPLVGTCFSAAAPGTSHYRCQGWTYTPLFPRCSPAVTTGPSEALLHGRPESAPSSRGHPILLSGPSF